MSSCTCRSVSLLDPARMSVVPHPVAKAFSSPGAQAAASSAPAIAIGDEFTVEGDASLAKTASNSIVLGL